VFSEHGHSASQDPRHGSHGIVELSSGLQPDSPEDVPELRCLRPRSEIAKFHNDDAASGDELAAVRSHRSDV